jgi:hypothetical protein
MEEEKAEKKEKEAVDHPLLKELSEEQRDLVRRVVESNPLLTVEEAIKQLRAAAM